MKKVFLVFMSLMFIMCLAGCKRDENNINNDDVNVIKPDNSNIDIEPIPDKEEKLYCYLFLELDDGLSNVALKCKIIEKDSNFDPIKVEYNGCIYTKLLSENGKLKWVKD